MNRPDKPCRWPDAVKTLAPFLVGIIALTAIARLILPRLQNGSLGGLPESWADHPGVRCRQCATPVSVNLDDPAEWGCRSCGTRTLDRKLYFRPAGLSEFETRAEFDAAREEARREMVPTDWGRP